MTQNGIASEWLFFENIRMVFASYFYVLLCCFPTIETEFLFDGLIGFLCSMVFFQSFISEQNLSGIWPTFSDPILKPQSVNYRSGSVVASTFAEVFLAGFAKHERFDLMITLKKPQPLDMFQELKSVFRRYASAILFPQFFQPCRDPVEVFLVFL